MLNILCLSKNNNNDIVELLKVFSSSSLFHPSAHGSKKNLSEAINFNERLLASHE
jgi:hypothetical protein